jgi:hypothetical protein
VYTPNLAVLLSLNTITMVDIYLNVHESQIPFLSISNNDIERLSIHPFKWLRYVMFSICGAKGHLSATLDGLPVDYNSTSLSNAIYYYHPSGIFVVICENIAHYGFHFFRGLYLCGL